MKDSQLQSIAEKLLGVFPLLNKRLLPPINLSIPDLSLSHFQILVTLDEIGMMATSEIGKRLSILKPNVTPLINTLIKYEFVERIPSEVDRRYIFIKLTEKGRAFLRDQLFQLQTELKEKLRGLTQEDLDALDHSLKTLIHIIFKMTEGPFEPTR